MNNNNNNNNYKALCHTTYKIFSSKKFLLFSVYQCVNKYFVFIICTVKQLDQK